MTAQNTFISLFRTILDKPYWQKDVTYRGLNGTEKKMKLQVPLDVTYLGASALLERLDFSFQRLKIKTGATIVPIDDTTVTSVGDLAIIIEGLFHGVCPPVKTKRFDKRQQEIFKTLNTLPDKKETFLRLTLQATDQLYQVNKIIIRSLQPFFLDILHLGLEWLMHNSESSKGEVDWKKMITHPAYSQLFDTIEKVYKEKDFQSAKKIAQQQKMFFLLAATEFAPCDRDPDWSEYNRHCAVYTAYNKKDSKKDSQYLSLLSQIFFMKSGEDTTKYTDKEQKQIEERSIQAIAKLLPHLPKEGPDHPELFLRLLYLVCCKNADTTLYWYQPNTPPPSRFIDDAATYNYDKGLTTLTSKFFFDYLNGEYSAILKTTKIDSSVVATLLATICADTAKDFLSEYNKQLALSGPLDTPKQLHGFFESFIEAFNIEVNFYQKKWLLHFLTSPQEQQYFHCENGTTIPLPAKERTLLPILYSYVAQSTLIDREQLLIDGTTTLSEQSEDKLLFFHKYLKTAIAQYFQESPYSFSIYTLFTALSVYQKTESIWLYKQSYTVKKRLPSHEIRNEFKLNPIETDYSFLPPDLNMKWFVPLFKRQYQRPFPSRLTLPSHISPAMLRALKSTRGMCDTFDSIEEIILHSPTPEMLEELPSLFPRMENLTIKGACTEETLQYLENCINIKHLTLKGLALTTIPNIAKLRYLQSLYLSKNNLMYIDLSALKALKVLDLSYNNLSHIDLSALKALKVLDLSYNNLTHIDLSALKALQSLALSYNNLSHIDLSALKALKVLHLLYNKLETLPQLPEGVIVVSYKGNSNLQSLSLHAPYPKKINLSNCQLSQPPECIDLPCHPLELDLTNNAITTPQSLYYLPAWGTIDLENNPIEYATAIELQETRDDPNYSGPSFHINMAKDSDDGPPPPLDMLIQQFTNYTNYNPKQIVIERSDKGQSIDSYTTLQEIYNSLHSKVTTPEQFLNTDQRVELQKWLHHLTKFFDDQESLKKEWVCKKVLNFLFILWGEYKKKTYQKEDSFYQQFFPAITAYANDCADAALFAIEEIDNLYNVQRIEINMPSLEETNLCRLFDALLPSFVRQWTLEFVYQKNVPTNDKLEAHFVLYKAVTDSLNSRLGRVNAAQVPELLYKKIAGVYQQYIREAERSIISYLTDETLYDVLVTTRQWDSIWNGYVRKNFPQLQPLLILYQKFYQDTPDTLQQWSEINSDLIEALNLQQRNAWEKLKKKSTKECMLSDFRDYYKEQEIAFMQEHLLPFLKVWQKQFEGLKKVFEEKNTPLPEYPHCRLQYLKPLARTPAPSLQIAMKLLSSQQEYSVVAAALNGGLLHDFYQLLSIATYDITLPRFIEEVAMKGRTMNASPFEPLDATLCKEMLPQLLPHWMCAPYLLHAVYPPKENIAQMPSERAIIQKILNSSLCLFEDYLAFKRYPQFSEYSTIVAHASESMLDLYCTITKSYLTIAIFQDRQYDLSAFPPFLHPKSPDKGAYHFALQTVHRYESFEQEQQWGSRLEALQKDWQVGMKNRNAFPKLFQKKLQ